jgi:hypothetical protein
MLGRESLGVPTEEVVEEAVRMFLKHYGRQRQSDFAPDAPPRGAPPDEVKGEAEPTRW